MANYMKEYNNVYKNGIVSHKPYFWWHNIKQRIHNHKMAKQRAIRGWCDDDTWDIEYWFLSIVPQMIDYFIEHDDGAPSDMKYHEWVQILAKMRNHLYYALDNNVPENIFWDQLHKILNKCRAETNKDDTITVRIDEDKAREYGYDDIKKAYFSEEQRRQREIKRNFEEGMKLFTKHLRDMRR